MQFSWWLIICMALPFVMLMVSAVSRLVLWTGLDSRQYAWAQAVGVGIVSLHGLGLIYLLVVQRPPVPPIDSDAPLQTQAMTCTRCDRLAGCEQRHIRAGDVMHAGEWCIGTVMEKEHGI